MASSKAATVEAYLQELPEERRVVVAAVRNLVNQSLPQGYVETMRWGMISWEIALARYPATYNKQPLGYVALAAQRNHYALYLMGVYADSQDEKCLRQAYALAGRKLDMGKSCLRFRKPEDLLAEEIGALIASMPVDAFIAQYEALRARA